MRIFIVTLAAWVALAWAVPGQSHIILPEQPMGWGEQKTGSEWLADCYSKLNELEFSLEEHLVIMDRRDVEAAAHSFYKRLRSLIAILHMYEQKGQIDPDVLTRDETVGGMISLVAEDCVSDLSP